MKWREREVDSQNVIDNIDIKRYDPVLEYYLPRRE